MDRIQNIANRSPLQSEAVMYIIIIFSTYYHKFESRDKS